MPSLVLKYAIFSPKSSILSQDPERPLFLLQILIEGPQIHRIVKRSAMVLWDLVSYQLADLPDLHFLDLSHILSDVPESFR